ncbi:zinc finger protein 558-like [Cydia splendana]|uniref:zinc finger protein 558-like n=1 Tax=Cydia splendana TaxID=1100963 RepID=UPI00300D95CA
MSCFLCFICHSTVHSDTNVETREKYKELVGMKLCSDSHLCHVCCHLLRKLWLFKSICLRRSMEYPVLFSDQGTVYLQNSQIETVILCPDIEECEQHTTTSYHFTSDTDHTNQYVSLEDTDKIDITEEKDKYIESDDDVTEFNDYDQDIEKQNDMKIENKNEATEEIKPKEELNKNDDFYKIILSIEEQKAELEAKRREDKYLEAEFKCYNCAMAFLFKDTYQAHMMRHEESNGEHLCPICLLRFASSAVLRAHTQTHRERGACARCGATVGARRRNAHRAKCVNNSQAICHLCSKAFTDGNGLQQHIKRFHLSKTSSKTYSCHVCGKTYNNQAAVRTHMIKHINKKFPCPTCGARFSSPYTLAAHGRRHFGKRPRRSAPAIHHICTRSSPAPRVARGSARRTRWRRTAGGTSASDHGGAPRPYTTYVQEVPLPHVWRAVQLAVHAGGARPAALRQATTEERPGHTPHKFPCPTCGARFSSPYTLAAHGRRHFGKRPRRSAPAIHHILPCQLCSKTFTTQRSLASHMQTVHSTDKKYCCNLCGASYTSKKSLGAHIRRHTAQPKLCLCHLCGASFQGNSKLNRHLRSVCEKNKLEEELSAFYNQE